MAPVFATLPIAVREFESAEDSGSDCEDLPLVTIKNTFITVGSRDSDAGLESLELAPRGAKSCTARLAGGRGQLPSALQEPAVEPPAMEPALSESTPWGDSPVARAAELLPQWQPAAEPGTAVPVTLEIPLQVGLGHPLALGLAGGLQVDVSHEDGRLVISLRTASGGAAEVAVAGPPRVSHTPPPSSSGSTASPSTSSTAGDSDALAAPSPPPERAGRRAPQAIAIALARALAFLAVRAHGRGRVAAPRGTVGEWRTAAVLVPALRGRAWRFRG